MNCAVRYLLIRLRRSQLVPPERHGPSLEIVQRCGAGLTLQDQGLGLGSRTDPVLSPSAGEWARGTSPQQWGLSPTSPLSLLPAFRPHFGETKAAPASQVEPNGDGKPAITATHTPARPSSPPALHTAQHSPQAGTKSPLFTITVIQVHKGGSSYPHTNRDNGMDGFFSLTLRPRSPCTYELPLPLGWAP